MAEGRPAVADGDAAEAWAAWLRDVREAVLGGLRDGRHDLGAVLAERDTPGVDRIHVLPVLEAIPGAGKVATRRRLRELGVSGRTELGELDDTGVAVLLETFGEPVGAP